MSVTATSWAWHQTTESSGQRLVLIALADCCSEHDGEVGQIGWPSIAHLSRMTGIGESTVKSHLDRLAEVGLIVKVERRRRRDGRLGTWLYRLTTDAPAALEPTADRPAHTTADRAALDQSRPTGPLEPSLLNRKLEPSKALADGDFGRFWAQYPRKVDKKRAERAWSALSKADKQAALEAIPNHVAHWRAERRPERLIPHPTTWLNGARWQDHLVAPKPDERRTDAPGLAGLRKFLERNER